MDIIESSLLILLGAVLSSIAFLWKTRTERKKLIATALSDLLEIRHYALGCEVVLKEVEAKIAIPAEAKPILMEVLNSVLPIGDQIHSRYDSAISELSKLDPLLAFRMRSKNSVPNSIHLAHQCFAQAGIKAQAPDALPLLQSKIAPLLNDAVEELAKHHSLYTYWRVRRIVRNDDALPAEFSKFLDVVTAQLGDFKKQEGTS